MSTHRTGFVFDEHYLGHDTGVQATVVTRTGSFEVSPEPHPSSLFIIKRIKEFFDGSGLTSQMHPIQARAASEDEIAVYHTREYIAGIRALCAGETPAEGWGEIDVETALSPGTFEAALYAAGGSMNAVSAVMGGEVQNAYALLRPPGHHATRNQAMGFCIFNNTVIAAHHARNAYGLERIMIVDWDVHHGNGTQDAFYADPGVLFVSLHQQNWFPKLAGELEQVGTGAGAGYTVNIPLPAGTGDLGYRAAFEQLAIPIGFRKMSKLMVGLAEEVCDGKLVMLQAGGYSTAYVPYCTVAAVEPLVGVDLGMVDLYETSSELERSATVFSQETQDALAAARKWHRNWWKI